MTEPWPRRIVEKRTERGALLGRDPIDELVRGRAELRRAEDQDRTKAYLLMLERSQADTLIAFWKRLPPEEQQRVVRLLSEEEL